MSKPNEYDPPGSAAIPSCSYSSDNQHTSSHGVTQQTVNDETEKHRAGNTQLGTGTAGKRKGTVIRTPTLKPRSVDNENSARRDRTEPRPENYRTMMNKLWSTMKTAIISCCWMRLFLAPTLSTKKEIDCRKLFCEGFGGFYILINMAIVSLIFSIFWNSHPSYVHPDPKSPYFTIPECELNDERLELNRDCFNSTDSHFFTDERINRFVEVLHLIILHEGCTEGLIDKYNVATTFSGYYPKINDLVIINDFITMNESSTEETVLFVRTIKNYLKNYPSDTVQAHNDGFVYINDSLMEYCGYNLRPGKYIRCFLAGCFCTYFIIIAIRAAGRYIWEKSECCKSCRHEETAQPLIENIQHSSV